ncbi:hypothetical protein AVEN_213371-1 [Araneus ventricosus]|uniref:Uncharacterized protein n=1 Tax=Araneus ventricosus TaxID=182803 RepID=A0A4Y2GIE2_ARAVE|nr:hypothetical protein AVEN_213371-1 [Araneus ventricosus]
MDTNVLSPWRPLEWGTITKTREWGIYNPLPQWSHDEDDIQLSTHISTYNKKNNSLQFKRFYMKLAIHGKITPSNFGCVVPKPVVNTKIR